jgi:hypothetical protein
MVISKIFSAIAGAALVLLATPGSAQTAGSPLDPVISLNKSLYDVTDLGVLTITGTPGHEIWMLTDKHSAVNIIPGLGTFGLEFSQSLAIAPMGTMPPSGTMTATFQPDCASVAAQTPTFLQAVSIDPQQGLPLYVSNTDVLRIAKGDDCFNCPLTPVADPTFGLTLAGTAVYLPGIGNDFVFAAGAVFAEYGDGTARLTGEIVRSSAPTERFLFDTIFNGRIGPGEANYPPPTSPKMELHPSAYHGVGGPSDPNTWHYYPTFTGLLIGLDAFQGGIISIGRMGPAFQVGQGANGKDVAHGGSAWMTVGIVTQPTQTVWNSSGGGDINITIGNCPLLANPLCVVASAVDLNSPHQTLAPHALVMFQLGGKFLFTGNGGDYTEFPDGTARLQGSLVHETDATLAWDIDVTFSGHIAAGDPLNPPAGSPKLELLPTTYIWNSGPIDPATWGYYTNFSGTLKGAASMLGANLLVTRRGPAFQVGDGASGKNINYGGSAWTYFDVISQPSQGAPLAIHTDGDINVDLLPCP